MPLEVEVDTPCRDDERPPGRSARHLERHGRQRHGHGIVRVHHVRLHVGEHVGQLPARVDVELAAGREADEAQSFARAPAQLAVGVSDEHGRVTPLLEPGHREQDLVLTAAPRARRVHVHRPNRIRSGCHPGYRPARAGGCVRMAQSLANFRKT